MGALFVLVTVQLSKFASEGLSFWR
jgi:hypothetical protein